MSPLRKKARVAEEDPGRITQYRGQGYTRSCWQCGRHKPTNLGTFRPAAGRKEFFCHDCRPETPHACPDPTQ